MGVGSQQVSMIIHTFLAMLAALETQEFAIFVISKRDNTQDTQNIYHKKILRTKIHILMSIYCGVILYKFVLHMSHRKTSVTCLFNRIHARLLFMRGNDSCQPSILWWKQ
jgi:hypothetical protein